jgi:hypothetical protein
MDLYVSSRYILCIVLERTYVAFRYTTHLHMPMIPTAISVSITSYLRSGDWTSDERYFWRISDLSNHFIRDAHNHQNID